MSLRYEPLRAEEVQRGVRGDSSARSSGAARLVVAGGKGICPPISLENPDGTFRYGLETGGRCMGHGTER
ncbi:MAG: hypothetical protein PVJ27_03705 [Candidatus Brocadiaceae bacterium]|jgi:hypothetical protein